MTVSIVTCLHNSYKYFPDLYNSIKIFLKNRYSSFYVYDNGSEDEANELIPKLYPEVKYIYSPINILEGAGVATVLNFPNEDYILKIDPDIVFTNSGVVDVLVGMLNLRDAGVAVNSYQYAFKHVPFVQGVDEAEMILGTCFMIKRDFLVDLLKKHDFWSTDLPYGVCEWQGALSTRRMGKKVFVNRIPFFHHYGANVNSHDRKYLPYLDKAWAEFNRKYGKWETLPENMKFYG